MIGAAWAILKTLFGGALKSSAGRIVIIVVAAATIGAAALWLHGERQYQRGAKQGGAAAREQAWRETEAAINELASEADRARVLRRACVEHGRVWNNADNQCNAR
ncbi:molecular chaperone [Stappia sp.]|uniref:molecular chaperone n=1 Tax=Stappia sp. TaxID=1870903 RepID=UPI0025DEEEDD|nr:molecular chaperone [Stappia sp.]